MNAMLNEDVMRLTASAIVNHPDFTEDVERTYVLQNAVFMPRTIEQQLEAAKHTIAENQRRLDERDELRRAAQVRLEWCWVLAITSIALFTFIVFTNRGAY